MPAWARPAAPTLAVLPDGTTADRVRRRPRDHRGRFGRVPSALRESPCGMSASLVASGLAWPLRRRQRGEFGQGERVKVPGRIAVGCTRLFLGVDNDSQVAAVA